MTNQKAASDNWVSGVELWHYAVEGRTCPDAVIPVEVWVQTSSTRMAISTVRISRQKTHFVTNTISTITVSSGVQISQSIRAVLDADRPALVDRILAVPVQSEAGCL